MLQKPILLFHGFIEFILILYRRRSLIFEMAKRDIASQYVGSALGVFWTFINPLVMISILWFVFSVCFKSAPTGGIPYVVWLTAGMAIWNTFSEVANSSTGVLLGNAHLVKKVVFPLSILPVVKLVGSFITHVIFLSVLFCLIMIYKLPFSLYWLQALYYFGAMSVLALGIGWITSSVNIFARDTAQIVSVVLQFGFWATPVLWDYNIAPKEAQFLLKLNPMFYIVQGYRDSFFYQIPFWHHWQMSFYFWGVTLLIFAIGATVFLRLRPHFADVL
jgi:lipopolysaccharide transport system permease protein/teichoic acid transport system permease protein